MTYGEALEYIHKISWRGSKPGLSRITELCARLGNPEKALRFIHVAGTNGKGSFCSMMSSILIADGKRVGTFTSPYIVRFNDRMCINNVEIDDSELAELVEYVVPFAEEMEDKPTEFELISAIGFVWFKKHNCDIVVLEAGMGGRYDSTNVIEKSVLSVITGIDFDHTAILGDTLPKIAWEKAGIIKENCPILTGEVPEDALAVIEKEAKEKHSCLYKTDYSRLNVISQTLDGTVFDFDTVKNARIRLLGNYQPRNASLVISAARLVGIKEGSIYKGLDGAIWHARFEILSREPMIIYDGGHNDQGVRLCVESVKQYFDTPVILVSGVMKDKAYEKMAKTYSEVCEYVFTLEPDNPRALRAQEYADVFNALGAKAVACENEEIAISKALEKQKECKYPILCAGSLYMYEKLSREVYKAIK